MDHNDPVIKQLKVLGITVLLNPLVARAKKFSEKVVLFGSCARGENIPKSDIDLFILTNNPEKVREFVKKHSLSKKLQVIIRDSLKFAEMKKKEPIFFEEISRGITLWEVKE